MLNKLFTALLFLGFLRGEACTAFQLKADDGSLVYCRSMEYGFPLGSDLVMVPQGESFTGTAPQKMNGLVWKSTYGFVGMNQSFAKNLVSDGMNEKGLVVGNLYLPHFTKYEPFDAKRVKETIGGWELATYLLSTCATTCDVKALLPKIVVADEPIPSFGDFILPLHLYVADAKGSVIVIEYVDGKCEVHENKIGVLTNSPPFDWQMNNLSNYVNLSPENVDKLAGLDEEVKALSQGSGLIGLPGDYTAPSRFVKATLFSGWARPQKTGLDAVRMGVHIMNTFDIFDGIIRLPETTKSNESETTQWIIIHDQTALKTYFRGYESLELQMVDIKKIDFTKPGLKKVALKQSFAICDETNNLKVLP